MTTDLERAFNAINAKRPIYDKLWRYYDGDHPLVYSAERLKEVFEALDAHFSENWCAVVLDSVLDRLHIERFNVATGEADTERLTQLWSATELNLDARDAHLCAMVTGEAFYIAGQGEDGEIEAYYNDSRLVHVFYDPARPRQKQCAAKWWNDEERHYITLYYPDRFEYYDSERKDVSSAAAFQLTDTAPNTWGTIPVFHLRRERRAIRSELANVIAPQAALNKLLADMMVAGEFASFPQRYIITANAGESHLKNAPNLIWQIPAGDGVGQPVTVGELTAAQLANYLGAIDRSANVIAAVSRTPKHYFFGSSEVPSGDALATMETPLVKKVTRYSDTFEPVYRKLLAFLLRLEGRAIEPTDIDVMWADPTTKLPSVEAQVVEGNVRAGIPLKTVLRRQGWTDTEIEQLDEDRAEEELRTASMADALLENAQRNFDQGNGA